MVNDQQNIKERNKIMRYFQFVAQSLAFHLTLVFCFICIGLHNYFVNTTIGWLSFLPGVVCYSSKREFYTYVIIS